MTELKDFERVCTGEKFSRRKDFSEFDEKVIILICYHFNSFFVNFTREKKTKINNKKIFFHLLLFSTIEENK